MLWVIFLLIGLLLGIAILRFYFAWPSDSAETAVLIGILVLSLLPIVLPLLDIVIERGRAIEYAGIKVDFSHVRPAGMTGITVPANIGTRGQPVSNSSTVQILDSLRAATSCDLVIIDLEEGQAWWETRLLVLLAGAVRLKKPDKFVFLGTDAGKQHCFQGWASAEDLLPHLVRAHPQYLRSLQTARAASYQWDLLEPVTPPNPIPPQPPIAQPGLLATRHSWMAFDYATGLHSEFLTEQLLASDLGEHVETKEPPRSISLTRLEELFRPVLHRECIDQSWTAEQQLSAFFQSDAPYIAMTQNGTFVEIVSRLAVQNQILKAVVEQASAR